MKRYHRQIIHMLGMLPFAILAYYIDNGISRQAFLFCAFVFLVVLFGLEIFRLKRQHLYQKFMSKIAHLYKENEQNRFLSTIWSPIILIVLGLFFSKLTILSTICLGGLSDSLAAIIGMRYGRNKNKHGKTWLGSAVYCFTAFLFIIISANLLQLTINIFFAILLALMAAFLERYCTSHKTLLLDDDFVIPMVFALCMELGSKLAGITIIP